jgi:hypothetical protein
MRRPALHCLTAAVLLTAITGCSDQLVSPLPVSTPVTATSTPTATPATTPSASATNTPVATEAAAPPQSSARATRTTRAKPAKTTRPAEPSACMGAVEYNVDTTDEMLPGSLCLEVGGVLIVRNIGPGDDNGFSITPESMTDGFYAAGSISNRFVRPGTAIVKFPRENGDIHTITVVVKA